MDSPLRVVVAARTGGAGKTAVSTLLSRELARLGSSVLVVDLDPQYRSVSLRLGVNTTSPLQYTAVDLLLGPDGREWTPVAVTGRHPGRGKLDVIPGNQTDLARLEGTLRLLGEELAAVRRDAALKVLDARLTACAVGYDFVVIDTPTMFGEITSNALSAADIVVSPIDLTTAADVGSVRDLLDHLAAMDANPLIYFVPNHFVRQHRECRDALERAKALCGSRLLLRALMPRSTEVAHAMSEQREVDGWTDGGAQVREAVWQLGQEIIRNAQLKSVA